MHIVLFDNAEWRTQLYPLVLTRPVADLRVGIVTIAEKWGKWMNGSFSYLTADYLQEKFPLDPDIGDDGELLVVRANVLPDERLRAHAVELRVGEGLEDQDGFIMLRLDTAGFELFQQGRLDAFDFSGYTHPFTAIRFPENIFQRNGEQIELDFDLLTKGRISEPLSSTNQILGDRVFAEAGAKAECAVFNSTTGPIYLGKNSEVMEGSTIRGGFALGEHAQLKMGTRIYSDVTVGPHSRAGGELSASVIWGYSSKGHDGFLGCAVLGEWCNWGAGTSNSNLKNNYKNVKVFDYSLGEFRDSGLQFCGLIMGDHSKSAIGTTFNTGTVVGVGANVFDAGFPPKFVPDFAWGGAAGFVTHRLENMMETAGLVYGRRNRIFDQQERGVLASVFELTKPYRTF